MDINIIYCILIIVGICVGIALAWFLVELVMTIRKTRNKVDEIHEQLTPTIQNVEKITEKVQPAIDNVEPLIERVSLTIDAANLELMRADQILENVNVIAEGAANATTAVGNIASAPVDLINKAGQKIQGFIGGKKSKVKGELGEGSDNIDQIVDQAKHQGKLFGRKVKSRKKKLNKKVEPEHSSGGNPYVSIN